MVEHDPVIEDQLSRRDYKIIRFFDRMAIKKVPVEKLKAADPDLLSFLNVNTPEVHDTCRGLAAEISNKKE